MRAWLAVALISCRAPDTRVEYDDTFSTDERRAIDDVAAHTAIEVRRVLPGLPRSIALHVRSGKNVIPETGESATAMPPAAVMWTVDRERGVLATVNAQLRPTLFHEFHHLVRDALIERKSLMDAVVSEGLATAFERDFAGVDVPWAHYPHRDLRLGDRALGVARHAEPLGVAVSPSRRPPLDRLAGRNLSRRSRDEGERKDVGGPRREYDRGDPPSFALNTERKVGGSEWKNQSASATSHGCSRAMPLEKR